MSEAGVLAYQPDSTGSSSQLVWLDRAGKQLGTVSEGLEGDLFDVELSPDGTRAAISIARRGRDIWLYDVARNLPTRFTLDPANDFASVWSPDGTRIVFESMRSGSMDLFQKSASGAGAEHVLLQADGPQRVYSWSRRRSLHLVRDRGCSPGW